MAKKVNSVDTQSGDIALQVTAPTMGYDVLDFVVYDKDGNSIIHTDLTNITFVVGGLAYTVINTNEYIAVSTSSSLQSSVTGTLSFDYPGYKKVSVSAKTLSTTDRKNGVKSCDAITLEPLTLSDEIARLTQAKADIKAAIEAKGVTVGSGTIDTYASKIGEISSGGSGSSGHRITVVCNNPQKFGSLTIVPYLTKKDIDTIYTTLVLAPYPNADKLNTASVVVPSNVTSLAIDAGSLNDLVDDNYNITYPDGSISVCIYKSSNFQDEEDEVKNEKGTLIFSGRYKTGQDEFGLGDLALTIDSDITIVFDFCCSSNIKKPLIVNLILGATSATSNVASEVKVYVDGASEAAVDAQRIRYYEISVSSTCDILSASYHCYQNNDDDNAECGVLDVYVQMEYGSQNWVSIFMDDMTKDDSLDYYSTDSSITAELDAEAHILMIDTSYSNISSCTTMIIH